MIFSNVISNYASQISYLMQRIEDQDKTCFSITYPGLINEVFDSLDSMKIVRIKSVIIKLETLRKMDARIKD